MGKEKLEEFIVLQGQIIGKGPFSTEYSWDYKRFGSHKEAVSHGFETCGSDDFNIGVLDGNRLQRFMWMDKDMDSTLAELLRVERQIGLEQPHG